jgi:hypothetical protein
VSIVVDILLLQTVSIAVASASVVAGIVYYASQVRHQTKIRETDLLTRLYSIMVSKDWLEAWQKVQDREVLDHSDYLKKYGFVELNEVYVFFKQLGMLMKRGLIDVDLIPLNYGQVKVTWEKIRPVLEGGRKRFNEPKLGIEVEYLCSELEKREKRGVKNG